jgi:hypothetical protein
MSFGSVAALMMGEGCCERSAFVEDLGLRGRELLVAQYALLLQASEFPRGDPPDSSWIVPASQTRA